MNEYLKCGGLKKHIVLKITDINRYLSPLKVNTFKHILNEIEEGRKLDNKPLNEYLVINTDEPYIGEVIEVLKKYNAWNEKGKDS